MEKKEQITISREEWEEMKERLKLLDCLEAAGVDNWQGYEYAWELMEDF